MTTGLLCHLSAKASFLLSIYLLCKYLPARKVFHPSKGLNTMAELSWTVWKMERGLCSQFWGYWEVELLCVGEQLLGEKSEWRVLVGQTKVVLLLG